VFSLLYRQAGFITVPTPGSAWQGDTGGIKSSPELINGQKENQLLTKPMRYSIVIPAYNEEKRIGNLLSDLQDPDAEFIFVCDGTDSTPDIIRSFAGLNPGIHVRCLTFDHRLGKGGGVYEGFRAATAPLVGFMDADNSTVYTEMQRLIHEINGHDGIIGSRHMPGSLIETHQPLSRRFQSRIFNLIIRCLFGLSFYDTQCGAKVFTLDALRRVMPELRARGFEFDVELLWKMKRKGMDIIERPVIWNNTGDSRLQRSDAFSMFLTLLRLRLGLL
jgi:glycosyltransferase involved in cell wall biosynthesis